MKARQKPLGRREILEAYISQINWDWLFLKGQLIFVIILLSGFMAFLFWFLR